MRAAPFVPPHKPMEVAVAAIWAEVLRVERVGVDDEFETLGGDSILVVELLSRLREAFHARVDRVDFLKASTVAQQALLLQPPTPDEVAGELVLPPLPDQEEVTDDVQLRKPPARRNPLRSWASAVHRGIRRVLGDRRSPLL